MDNKDLTKRIIEPEQQLRRAKEDQINSFEHAEMFRQMYMEITVELVNLLSNSNMGAVCLDLDLRIKSITPGILDLFHIRDSDIGRPLTDLVSKIIYEDLEKNAKSAITNSALK